MPLAMFPGSGEQKPGPSPSHYPCLFKIKIFFFYLGGRIAFKISSACFVGSGTQEMESLDLGGCGIGPEGPGCWGLTFNGRDWEEETR